MKIYSGQLKGGAMGIGRVFEGLQKYLPQHGMSFVDTIQKADVVHSHIALYEHIPSSIPLVLSSHGMLWNENGWEVYTAEKINRMCFDAYLQADVVTSPSRFVANAIQRHTGISPLVVRHGIDIDAWTPEESQGYVLWNKGRTDAANDPVVVSHLASLAPEVHFISTFGSQGARNLQVVGAMPHDRMKSYIQRAGVYLDTPKESGGPCFGVLEAMASGIPVLAWREGGNAEAVIHRQTGYLATPGDYQDLLNGLYFCLQNRDVLGATARDVVAQNYTWDKVIQGYKYAYELAVERAEPEVDVSIIIPAYNLGEFLKEAVESALNQDYPSKEVIVINDCSNDNTAEILDNFGDQVKVYSNSTNLHVADSRNIGIWHARGKYILPLDADDRLTPDAVSKLVTVLENRQNSIAAGHLLVCHEKDRDHFINSGWPNTTDILLQFQGQNRLPYSSMYRRKDVMAVGGYRRRIRNGTEDADLWTRFFQYGYTAHIIDDTTLLYTHRDSSLGKTNADGPNWLDWYAWRWNTVFPGAARLKNAVTYSFNPPQVSVIIPVGPGHEAFLQTCADSVMMQTFPFWEMVVINDTGKRWFDDNGQPLTQYVTGIPATFIDKESQLGPAAARNLGIQSAQAPLVVFLDVDDIAQPSMLGVLVAAHEESGGWIYGDWYQYAQGQEKYTEAPDWDVKLFLSRQLAPITGLYEKKHILSVGGFDTDAPGWEDWNLQLRLFEQGICGTRVKYPLIRYHLDTGTIREDNLKNKDAIIKYIEGKFKDVYSGIEGGTMGCLSCGGKKTVVVKTGEEGFSNMAAQTVPMRYVGASKGSRHYKSPITKTTYKTSPNRIIPVKPQDVSFFQALGGFEVVQQVSTPEKVVQQEVKPQTVSAPISPEMFKEYAQKPLGTPLAGIVPDTYASILEKAGFKTMEDLQVASDAQLMAVKHIGVTRKDEIRELVKEWLTKR